MLDFGVYLADFERVGLELYDDPVHQKLKRALYPLKTVARPGPYELGGAGLLADAPALFALAALHDKPGMRSSRQDFAWS